MQIDFTPLLQLPRKEKLALVRLLVESMESEESAIEQTPLLSKEQIQRIEGILKRIAKGDIQFYPWSEARERLRRLTNE